MKKIFIISTILLSAACSLWAQSPQLITYHGQLRTLMSDNRLYGNILENDSLSPKRGAVGSIFLDLGITVMPNENFRLMAELRMRNIIGQDQQDPANNNNPITGNTLIDTRVIFRQIRAEGNIKGIVDYQIGDIDVGMTKYTLHDYNEVFNTYEGDLFKERRHIPEYENFQNGNKWRLQGINASTEVNFRRVIRNLKARGFATRTRMNSDDGLPDRFIVGADLEVKQSRLLTLGINWINMFDVPGSALNDTLQDYSNNVLSFDYAVNFLNKTNYSISLVGENGISSNNYFIDNLDTTVNKNDFFLDIGIEAKHKQKNIKLSASYINVGHNFTSPGAQTLRLRPFATPRFLPYTNNATQVRDLTLYDRYTDEYVYNQRIQTGLMSYAPVYGNVLPYGQATPNRNGLVFNLGRDLDTTNVLSFNVGGAILSELVSEGDSIGQNLRKFTQLKGGVALNIGKMAGFDKALVFSTGARYENTKRDGGAFINFSSTLFDAGVTVEVLKGLSLLGGMKYIQGNGTEVITLRDDFGSIEGYTPYLYDVEQTLVSGGVRLMLFKDSFGSIEYNYLDLRNKADSSQSYSMGNFFVNFTLRF